MSSGLVVGILAVIAAVLAAAAISAIRRRHGRRITLLIRDADTLVTTDDSDETLRVANTLTCNVSGGSLEVTAVGSERPAGSSPHQESRHVTLGGDLPSGIREGWKLWEAFFLYCVARTRELRPARTWAVNRVVVQLESGSTAAREEIAEAIRRRNRSLLPYVELREVGGSA